MDPGQPMIDWINSAPPAEVAVELLAAFGSGDTKLTLAQLTDWIFRTYPKQTGIITRARPVQEAILEAIQLLEHSELIYVRVISDDWRYWSITRFGTATVAAGKDAVRQRIKDRTGL
jgi:hypothetical protein